MSLYTHIHRRGELPPEQLRRDEDYTEEEVNGIRSSATTGDLAITVPNTGSNLGISVGSTVVDETIPPGTVIGN